MPVVALQARRAFSFVSLRCVEAYFHAGVHQAPASDVEVQGTQG